MAKNFVARREELPATEITQKEISLKITSDLSRRVSFLQRKKMMNDNFKEMIDMELRYMFSEESYLDMRRYIDVSNNLCRRVLREISTVYKTSPTRSVTPKGSEKSYSKLTGCDGGFNLDQKMARANYLLNGLNDLIFQIGFTGEKMELHTYTPEMVSIFENPDNPTVVDALLIEDYFTDGNGQRVDQWIYWSPTRHFIVDKDHKIRTVDGNEDMLNPFRDVNIATGNFYPFFFAHNSTRENCFWDLYTGSDLFEGTKMIALQNTFRNFMVPMQFKQIAVKMNTVDNNQMIKSNQIKSPLHIFQTNGDVQVLDWQSNIIQLGESIQNTMLGIAGNYGISQENFKLQANPQSGFAMQVQKQRLSELREEQKKVWKEIEEGIFDCVRANTELYQTQDKIAPNASIEPDFIDGEELNDPQQELDIMKQKVELGVTSLLDYIKQENPDIEDDEEAEAFLNKNIELKNRLTSRYSLNFSSQTQGVASGQKQ